MAIKERRERERAERERLIITAARELAEAEGWDAVTTRRLAERVEYSQPVLYSHFAGKDAIMAAVAMEGFDELAKDLRRAHDTGLADSGSPVQDAAARRRTDDPLAAVGVAYTTFAERRPALYDAMFNQAVDLRFAADETPEPLKDAFTALADAVAPYVGSDDVGLVTETFWAGLHGLVTLMRGGRLPREAHDTRLALLLARFR